MKEELTKTISQKANYIYAAYLFKCSAGFLRFNFHVLGSLEPAEKLKDIDKVNLTHLSARNRESCASQQKSQETHAKSTTTTVRGHRETGQDS